MFVIIGVVMVINARSARPGYRKVYALTAAAMVIGRPSLVVIGKLLDSDWRHQILWLEILELVPFAVYWAAQTFEHWEGGVPTGAERDQRAEDSRVLAPVPPRDRVRQRASASRTAAAIPAWSRPSAERISSGVPAWGMNRAGIPSEAVTVGRRQFADPGRDRRSDPTVADAVFGGDHRPVAGGVGDHHRVEGGAAPRIPHRDVDACLGEVGRGAFGGGDELADGDHARRVARIGRLPHTAGSQAGTDLVFGDLAGAATGVADGDRPVVGEQRASAIITCNSWALDGASTRIPGTLASIAMSYTPWWLGPSGPVIPARSMQNTTGRRCNATSYTTWSQARLRNVE